MASTRASGSAAVRYGTMLNNVLGLRAVLADGRCIHTGGRARKSAAGYDLTRLLIGAEGTLGIITELTLRLTHIPAATAAAVCPLRTIESAVEAAIAVISSGTPSPVSNSSTQCKWAPSIAIHSSITKKPPRSS